MRKRSERNFKYKNENRVITFFNYVTALYIQINFISKDFLLWFRKICNSACPIYKWYAYNKNAEKLNIKKRKNNLKGLR